MFTTVIALLIVLGLVVFIHELGHFVAARWAGAKVEVFSIGFGKPILRWRDKKNTEWRIAWLPLGGFVSIYGQDDMFDREKYNALSSKEKIGHYLSLPSWKQAVVIGAGVFMNLFMAWIIYSGLFMQARPVQMPVIGTIEQTTKNLKVGDRIMQINGEKITTWSEMLVEKELNAGEGEIDVLILRKDKLVKLKMPAGTWGILPDAKKTEMAKYGFTGAIKQGAAELWTQSKLLFVVIGQIASGERSAKNLGGFLSIAEASGRALTAGWVAFLSFVALLSVNLGVINLFPLPVLDGGYLLILLIQAITQRKMQGKTMDWIMRVGWWLLIALMLFTFWNDIARLIAK